MRIHFKNLGQANLYLKTCKLKLTEDLKRRSTVDESRVPTQRIRNAFCQGFGYSSYEELTRLLSSPSRERKLLPSEEDFLTAFTKAFTLAFEVSSDYGHEITAIEPFVARLNAQTVIDKLKREGSAYELFKQSSSEKAREFMDEAWGLVDNGNPFNEDIPGEFLLQAQMKFNAAIEADPELADAYNGLAFVALCQKNFESARDHSQAALEKACNSLGGDEPRAYTWYGDLKTRPYMRARHNLGLSFMRLGDWKAALNEFKEMLKRNPNDNQGVRYLIGPLYHQAGNLRQAIPAYRRAAGNDEYSGDPHNEFNYALALYETGKYEEAALRLRYAFLVNLHVAEILLNLPLKRLDIWYGSNQFEPDYAIEYLEEYGQLWEDKSAALAFLSACYFHPTVQAEIAEYIKLARKINKVEVGAPRSAIANKMTALKSLSRLKGNNKEIADELLVD